MDMSKIIGCRFFKAKTNEDGSTKLLELYKVTGIKNSEEVSIKDLLKDSDNIRVTKEYLEDNYTLLEPDAYISFNIVRLQDNIEDIIVSMFRVKDMLQNNATPYCVCRQNITNLYGAMIRTQDLSSEVSKEVGMCMSIESIPDGVDYKVMTACNSIRHYTMVAAYMDDKLSDILSCVKLKKYDEVLEFLFQEHMKHVTIDRDIVCKDHIHMGYCRTLKDLLEYNNFMYDFRRAFGIAEIQEIELSKEIKDYKLSDDAKKILMKYYNKYILDEIAIKFDKGIDLEAINKNMIMVCDKNEEIYIITYTASDDIIDDFVRANTKLTPNQKLEAIYQSASNIPTIPKSLL